MTVASVTVTLAVASPGVIAQMSQNQDKTTQSKQGPGQPNPNDRGGEFIITGCLSRDAATAGQPAMFKITHVSPGQANVGEGRAVGAMGGGTPITGVTNSSAAAKTDPPDIVKGEYRIVSTERTDLAKFADQQVEARGRLRGGAMAKEGRNSKDSKMATDSSTMAGGMDVFEAASVKKLAGSCATPSK